MNLFLHVRFSAPNRVVSALLDEYQDRGVLRLHIGGPNPVRRRNAGAIPQIHGRKLLPQFRISIMRRQARKSQKHSVFGGKYQISHDNLSLMAISPRCVLDVEDPKTG
jgi:hypothetical protein